MILSTPSRRAAAAALAATTVGAALVASAVTVTVASADSETPAQPSAFGTTPAPTGPRIEAEVRSDRRPNGAGWYRTPVTVTFECTAGTAPLAEECPGPVTRRNTPAGFRLTREVTAVDGRSDSVTVAFRVDGRGPVLETTRRGTAPYARTARPIRCEATDGRSGIAEECTVSYMTETVERMGDPVRRFWTATATDVAGNTTTRDGSFRVR